MSVLQHHLFTAEHAKLFTETFNREVAGIVGGQIDRDQASKDRLAVVETELANLSANMRRSPPDIDEAARRLRGPTTPIAQILPY